MKHATDPITIAHRVLKTEIQGLQALSGALNGDFSKCVALIQNLDGHVVLAGVGKSGHVARKIAATLASTGTPALFVHPTEASHGDMGMIRKTDLVIALSRSGETRELADITRYCKRFAVPLIAMTGNKDSTLAKAADLVLLLPDTPEACALTGAPTTSTTLQMALGDALAVALLEMRGFTAKDFKTFHPGGKLGADLLCVADLMQGGAQMPIVPTGTPMTDALAVLSEKGFGCVGVISETGTLSGMITDGDIRRHMGIDLNKTRVDDIMTKAPKTASPETLAAAALRYMTAKPPKVMQLFVTDQNKPVGILHMHDLLKAGLG
ncbi:MAG TPA: KpsF/GutQ family sugar-phosphate isomerase [Hellea balneolensis]|uniref:KpsF/GutQ family sugar-phosphate isomerase n=1 Tax=Hellea balneolensis TaxID=287478 RepID=A0A7C5LU94_9PROT|nr:KpsF/GutQ family sugar-phosphate isomerase [Hellea balneolensis]